MVNGGSREDLKAPADRDWPNEAKLDEAYRSDPFPSFADWNASIPVDEARRADELRAAIDAEAEAKGTEALDRALKVALRAAAVDTGALEGLYATDEGITMTIARRAAGWEALAQSREILPFFEAQLAALEIVMDLVTKTKPLASDGVTEMAVKDLHAAITSAQATYEVHTPVGAQRHALPRGEYKTMPNHVLGADGSYFSYAPVVDTASEMRRFVNELSAERFSKAHPLVQSAYAHYGLVRIHPFADGNGRLARALSSLYLLRQYRVPLVVFAEDRAKYLEKLRAADHGRHGAFTEFVGWAVVGSLELVLDEIQQGSQDDLDSLVDDFNLLVKPDGEVDHLAADRAAFNLIGLASSALEQVVKEEQQRLASCTIRFGAPRGTGSKEGYRAPFSDAANGVSLNAAVAGPKDVQVSQSVLALVQRRPRPGEPLKLLLAGQEDLYIEASRLLPSDARVNRRLRNWAKREFASFMKKLTAQTKSEFGKLGL